MINSFSFFFLQRNLFSFQDERKRRQNDDQKELEELKQEVFNLPDNVERGLFCIFLL
jgi:hypothetical protein